MHEGASDALAPRLAFVLTPNIAKRSPSLVPSVQLYNNMALSLMMLMALFGHAVASPLASRLQPTPWTPPPVDSPELLRFLRDNSRPKLAYSTVT